MLVQLARVLGEGRSYSVERVLPDSPLVWRSTISRHERTCSSQPPSLIQHLNWRPGKVKRSRHRLRSESLLEQFDSRHGVGVTQCAPRIHLTTPLRWILRFGVQLSGTSPLLRQYSSDPGLMPHPFELEGCMSCQRKSILISVSTGRRIRRSRVRTPTGTTSRY